MGPKPSALTASGELLRQDRQTACQVRLKFFSPCLKLEVSMFEQLDEFSKSVSVQIEMHFPEWAERAQVEDNDGNYALAITVQSPSKAISYPLRIDTWGEEVTVSIDSYHAHFFKFEDGTDSDAVTFIKRIISDKFAIVSYWRDEQWCGSYMLTGEYLPTNNDEHPYANRIRIRSWGGSLDNDIECAPRG
jgi:hypothetical protein